MNSDREKSSLYEKHIREFRRKARDGFRELLEETTQITYSTPFEGPELDKIKSLIRVHPLHVFLSLR